MVDNTASAGSTTPSVAELNTDVLVVGGGPAGAAAGYWLAERGHDVTVIERKTFREKTCGDGLTPRAVHQLQEMGLGSQLDEFHRYSGLRAMGAGRALELEWPSHPVYPNYGYVVRRRDLDAMVAANAVASGAKLLEGHEAVHPIVDRGFVRGATVNRKDGSVVDIRAEFTIVADGANSRFGRALGTSRPATGRTARRSARIGRARSTPTRGSSRRSTSRTATAPRCRAMAGSSRSATAP